jgi:hypothetical protein
LRARNQQRNPAHEKQPPSPACRWSPAKTGALRRKPVLHEVLPNPRLQPEMEPMADINRRTMPYAFAVQYSTCFARASGFRFLIKYQVPMPIMNRPLKGPNQLPAFPQRMPSTLKNLTARSADARVQTATVTVDNLAVQVTSGQWPRTAEGFVVRSGDDERSREHAVQIWLIVSPPFSGLRQPQ